MTWPDKPAWALTQDEQDQLIIALQACNTVKQTKQRQAIVARLPDDLANRIDFDPAVLMHLHHMVSRCASWPRGVHHLGKAVLMFEGQSHPMRDLGRRLLPLCLIEAMCEIFDNNAPSLRFFIGVNLGAAFTDALPAGDTAALVHPMAQSAAERAAELGFIDNSLIEQLVAHEFAAPDVREYLRDIAATWLQFAPRRREPVENLSAGAVLSPWSPQTPETAGATGTTGTTGTPGTTGASALTPAPTSGPGSEPATQPGPPSRLSLIMDRWYQWQTLTFACSGSKKHLAFLIHGHVDQDLHLFSGRIQDYLSELCRPIHRVYQVKFRTQYTVADQPDIWSNHLRQALGLGRGFDTAKALERAALHEPIMLLLGNGVLRDLTPQEQQALLTFVGHDLPQAIRSADPMNPVRVLIPIAYHGASSDSDPFLQAVRRTLAAGNHKGLGFAELVEATYPTWEEVAQTLSDEHDGDPTELLREARVVYEALEHAGEHAGADKTFARLAARLDQLLARYGTSGASGTSGTP